MPTTAEVLEVMGKLGVKGVSRVRCKALDGQDRGKILTRNVIGPVNKGDVILLKETAMDTVARLQKR